MNQLDPLSIRPFIGAYNFSVSRTFYREIGFMEHIISDKLSHFERHNFGFYLQDYYVKDWVENSMIFLEVNDLVSHRNEIRKLKLEEKYPAVKISEIHSHDWGHEFFIHDPSGILWHIGDFRRKMNREDGDEKPV